MTMRTGIEKTSETERRFGSMADQVPVLLWETDHTGVVNVNGHYLAYFGASLEQVIGMGWAGYLHPDDAAGYIAAYRDASLHRRPYNYECRFRNREGKYCWLRNSAVPIGESGFFGSSSDVTELVETRESLERSRAELECERQEMQLRLNSVALASWYYDATRQIVGGDAKMQKLFHMDGSEASAETWIAAIVEEDRPRVTAAFEASLSGAPYDIKFRVVVDDEVRWLHSHASTASEQGRIVRMLGVCEDITRAETLAAELTETEQRAVVERKAAADLLRLESDRLQMSLTMTNATSFDWFPETDTVTWNGVPPFGVDPAQIPTGAFSLAYVHEDDLPGLTRALTKAMEDGEAYAYEYRARWADGSTKWIRTSGRAITDHDGATRFLGVNTDVTERRANEAALRQSEKLAAVGQLASTIAHEINNPLESVTNLLYICKTSTSDPDLLHYLTMAEIELRRVSVITNQTLRFHKQRSGPTSITCVDLFSSSLQIFQGKLENSHIQVAKRKRAERPVMCLEGEIRQVMNNLIGNAIDAMNKGGTLTIRSTEATDWRTGRPGLRLTVADTGTGINAAMMANLFQPFQTTKGIGGTGLGLWVSQEIVERHKGRLLVRTSTKPGHSGTVFNLFLPFDGPAEVEEALTAVI